MIDDAGRLLKLQEYVDSPSKCYPTLANGITLEGVAGAWTLGAFKEIIPANTITSDFSIYFIIIEGATLDDVYEIVLYMVETEIARVRLSIVDLAQGSVLPFLPVQTPRLTKNSQIQGKCANMAGGSEDITISLHYRVYPI